MEDPFGKAVADMFSAVVDIAGHTAEQLAKRIFELESAIRKHRDQRGDDRCWMDDEDLYRSLPEGYKPPERDTSVELENCRWFICNRRNPNTVYQSPEREIETLKSNLSNAMVIDTALRCSRRIQDAEIERLRALIVDIDQFWMRRRTGVAHPGYQDGKGLDDWSPTVELLGRVREVVTGPVAEKTK